MTRQKPRKIPFFQLFLAPLWGAVRPTKAPNTLRPEQRPVSRPPLALDHSSRKVQKFFRGSGGLFSKRPPSVPPARPPPPRQAAKAARAARPLGAEALQQDIRRAAATKYAAVGVSGRSFAPRRKFSNFFCPKPLTNPAADVIIIHVPCVGSSAG